LALFGLFRGHAAPLRPTNRFMFVRSRQKKENKLVAVEIDIAREK
jgi:hypothetical protein